MRAIWSGHITFRLISIPVGLYAALYEPKIGVVEWVDPEAREIGMREAPK